MIWEGHLAGKEGKSVLRFAFFTADFSALFFALLFPLPMSALAARFAHPA